MTVLMILLGIHLTLHSIECGCRLYQTLKRERTTRRGVLGERRNAPMNDADRRESLRREKEQANFLSYDGEEQLPIDEYELTKGDV